MRLNTSVQSDPLGILQEISTWANEQMVYAQPRICPGEWHTQTPLELWHTNGSLNLSQTTRPYKNQQQKRELFKIVDFAVPADHRVKLNESEKKDKYLDHSRDLNKLCNMKVTFIPIVIGSLGTITKGLIKGFEDLEIRRQVETLQTTALLR